MSKLSELEVDRVDAVDNPATGQKFLLLKSEDPDEFRANATKLAQTAHSALDELLKCGEGVNYEESTASALNALAKLLDFKGTFTAKAAPKKKGEGYAPEEDEEEEEGKKKPPMMKTEDLASTIQKSIADGFKGLLEELKKDLDEEPAKQEESPPAEKKAAPVSKQAKPASGGAKASGKPSFANVFFGK